MHSQIITIDNNSLNDVKAHSTSPKESQVFFETPEESSDIISIVKFTLEEVKTVISTVKLPAPPDESDHIFKPKTKASKLKNLLDNIVQNFVNLGNNSLLLTFCCT